MTNEARTWTVAGVAALALILGLFFLVEFVIAPHPKPYMFAIFAAVMVGSVVVTWLVSPKAED